MIRNRLGEILKKRNITQAEFAAQIGVSPQYVSGICSGRLPLSLKKMEELAGLLNVALMDLIVDTRDAQIAQCPHCGRPIYMKKAED